MRPDASDDAAVGRRWAEALGLLLLPALAAYFLAASWRRWPDPLIDFGRELYLPWRLAHGAVLYRDVDDFYGPLSQYANAVLFTVFGPGLMVLVAANLAVFAAILTLVYALCRRAYGAVAALVATSVFIAVFGFSQYDPIGNDNYVAPYAHETTHGMLVCLALAWTLVRALERETLCRVFAAGGLLGLAALLKPEILLAAAAVTGAALAARVRRDGVPPPAAAATWIAGAVLPTLVFAAYFASLGGMGAGEAMGAACRAWWNVAGSARFTEDAIQRRFLGFDAPWKHFVEEARATGVASVLLAAVAGAAWLADRREERSLRVLVGLASVGGLLWLARHRIVWLESGRCLVGLAAIYAVACARRPGGEPHATRSVLAALALALLARMVLASRLYLFGYYQAALATLLVPAVLIGELPARLRVGRWGRSVGLLGTLALVVPGVVALANESRDMLRPKTYPVGDGRDRFYSYPPSVEPTAKIVNALADALRTAGPGRTLVVLPEGEMLNYLTRMPSPVAPFIFFAAATAGGREERVVEDLERQPPDWVAIVSRDLREHGIRRYGEAPGSGASILRWVAGRYRRTLSVGGDPLDYRSPGGVLLRRIER